jgi:hypothetical protein
MRITTAVRNWASGAWPNFGLMLSANEADLASWKTFRSYQAGVDQPVVVVNYSEPHLGKLPYHQLVSDELTDRLRLHVNPFNGNAIVEAADVVVRGDSGLDLRLDRFYNSRSDRAGLAGSGWTLGAGPDVRLSENAGGTGDLLLEGPSGYRVWFTKQGNGWQPPPGVNASVTKGAGFDYAVEFHDPGLRYRFTGDPALKRIEDLSGNAIAFGYGGGRLTTITDTRARRRP